MSVFQFTTLNLTGLGRLGMGDIISNIAEQMRALGHEVIWNDDGFAIGDDVYVLIFESFFSVHIDALRQAHAEGAKIIIIATEKPGELGFNSGLTEELIVRQKNFAEATKYACAIWVTIPEWIPWYCKFRLPTAEVALGYAPGLVRSPEVGEIDHDFGFFGSMTPRRIKVLERLAREKVGDRRALVRYVQFESAEARDMQMARCKVIVQISHHEKMQILSGSRCCTALHIGRPVFAEHHAECGPWKDIIEFAHPDVFAQKAIQMLPRWREAFAEQFAKFKEIMPPEKCVGRTIKETLEPVEAIF